MKQPTITPTQTKMCECAKPAPQALAERKWAAQTVCARCGRPIALDLGRRAPWA